jgi:hypothetical protein
MASAQSASAGGENPRDEDLEAAAEQVRRQAAAMLKYLELYQGIWLEVFQVWTVRSEATMRHSLEGLEDISVSRDNQSNTDKEIREYGNLLVKTVGRLGLDIVDTWLHAIIRAQRNLRKMQRGMQNKHKPWLKTLYRARELTP